jgi:lipopolysaccharide export system protein LptA
MPLAIIINNLSIGKNTPDISATRSGTINQNDIGEAWIIPTTQLTEVWRPESEVWEVAIQGQGTYAGTHKVKYLRIASEVELNSYGIYTAGVTGSGSDETIVVKDTAYNLTSRRVGKLTAENGRILCSKHSVGEINAVNSVITIEEGSNVKVTATDSTITAASGTIYAKGCKITCSGTALVEADESEITASGSCYVNANNCKVTASGNVHVKALSSTVHASDFSIVTCVESPLKVYASNSVVCIVDDIEKSHAVDAMNYSSALQRFVLTDNAVVVSKTLGDYVWTSTGKYGSLEIKSFKEAPQPKRGRPKTNTDEEVAVD